MTSKNRNLTIVIENATIEVESLREMIKHLDRRLKQYESWVEIRKARILQDPTINLDKELYFIHKYESQIDAIWQIIREAKFDIEDITGEEEK